MLYITSTSFAIIVYMKNWVEKVLFICLNIFLSSCYLQLAFLIVISIFIVFFLPRPENDEDTLICFFIIPVLFSPLLWILKFNIFNCFFKCKQFENVQNFLKLFLTDKNWRRKAYAVTVCLDIITIIFAYFINIWGFGSIKEYLVSTAILTVILGGNLTTSYFLFQYNNKGRLSCINVTIFITALSFLLIATQTICYFRTLSLLFISLVAIPLVISAVLKIISTKYNWKKLMTVFCSTMIVIFNIVLVLVIEIIFYAFSKGYLSRLITGL